MSKVRSVVCGVVWCVCVKDPVSSLFAGVAVAFTGSVNPDLVGPTMMDAASRSIDLLLLRLHTYNII